MNVRKLPLGDHFQDILNNIDYEVSESGLTSNLAKAISRRDKLAKDIKETRHKLDKVKGKIQQSSGPTRVSWLNERREYENTVKVYTQQFDECNAYVIFMKTLTGVS